MENLKDSALPTLIQEEWILYVIDGRIESTISGGNFVPRPFYSTDRMSIVMDIPL